MLKRLAVTLATVATMAAAAATADGSDVYYTCHPNLCRVRPDGSGKKQLTDDGKPSDPYGGISADRTGRIGFSHGGHVFVANRDARHRKRLDDAFGTLVLHPDGDRAMWFADPRYNPRWCRGTLAPFDYRCRVLFRDSRDYLAWGPHHSLLSTDMQDRSTICTTRIDSNHEAACKHVLVREHGGRNFYLSPSLSPGEDRLATTTYFDTDGGSIAVYDLGTGTRIRRLTSGHQDRLPVWSPDGRYIAFNRAYPDGSWAVARVKASGGKVKVLARRKAGIYEVAWGD